MSADVVDEKTGAGETLAADEIRGMRERIDEIDQAHHRPLAGTGPPVPAGRQDPRWPAAAPGWCSPASGRSSSGSAPPWAPTAPRSP